MSKNDGGPVEVDKIFNCEETRTNLMIKNIPCKYTQSEIRADFDTNHKSRYNDLNTPMDKQNKTGKGYCFINFRHVLFVYAFTHDKTGYRWPKYGSEKTVEIKFAKEQPISSLE
jgi:hypothetical protein